MPSIKGTTSQDAGVVKLVYTTDSKSVAFGRGGSSPPTGTICRKVALIATFRRFRCLEILYFSRAYLSFCLSCYQKKFLSIERYL